MNRGYTNKGARAWKRSGDLTRLIELQGSRWGKAVYVSFGVMLSDRIVTRVPPGSGEWDISHRAESIESPYQEAFNRCAADDEDQMKSEEMRRALQWLVEWMESGVLEPHRIRQALREEGSWTRRGLVRVRIKQWAARDEESL